MQPNDSNVVRCASTTVRTRGSNGTPPRSLNQATRTPLKLRSRGRAKRSPGSLIESGARESGPAIVLNTKARSATERPKHPEVLSVDRANPAFGFGTRPIEGRKPTTLQNAAGLRSEPPVSDPVATGTSPQARADCRAARRTAAGFRQVVRIARRTENLVKGLRSRAKLRGVGLANGDRSGATHAFDNQIVFGGNVVFIQQRSKGRADTTGFHQVLVRDRKTMQWSQGLFARLHLIGLRGVRGGHFRDQSNDRIDLRIHPLDLLQMHGQRFARRQLLGADQPSHLDCTHKAKRGSCSLRL